MPKYIQLHIHLNYSDVWRRIQIKHNATFEDLHKAIQDVMPWHYAHMWHFAPLENEWEPFAGLFDAPPAATLKLSSRLKTKGEQFFYIYDFGDSWEHFIEVEDIFEDKARFQRKLIDGHLNAPPEDCGGAPGYARFKEFVETGTDPWGEDPEELLDWLEGWTPDGFELQTAQTNFDR